MSRPAAGVAIIPAGSGGSGGVGETRPLPCPHKGAASSTPIAVPRRRLITISFSLKKHSGKNRPKWRAGRAAVINDGARKLLTSPAGVVPPGVMGKANVAKRRRHTTCQYCEAVYRPHATPMVPSARQRRYRSHDESGAI